MAFITYILLAGMALGIQKRSELLPLPLSPDLLRASHKQMCVYVCEGSVQRFLDCVRALPSCGSSLRFWWCCWVCTCWRFTATSPPLTSSPTADTNMLGNGLFLCPSLQSEAFWVKLCIQTVDTSLPGWSSPCCVASCLAVMVILWG